MVAPIVAGAGQVHRRSPHAAEGMAVAEVVEASADVTDALRILASGLTEAHRRVAFGEPLTLPFPAALQRGLDRLTLLLLRSGQSRLPAGVPELIRWSHEPVDSWGLLLDPASPASGVVLLEDGIPTRECQEWALSAGNAEAELFENQIIDEVRRVCRSAGLQDSYVAFRELVIRSPVMTEVEFQKLRMKAALAPIADPLARCYPSAPLECRVDGEVATCADCANLLVVASPWECINDRCPRRGQPRVGRTLPVVEGVRWLASPMRVFVASPGLAEVRLRDRLVVDGVNVDMWPDVDAYDLRLRFADGMSWAVDVKDWANPFLLGQRVRPVPRVDDWDRAYIVPCRDAVNARPGYLQILRQASRHLRGSGTEILSEQRLRRAVAAKVAEVGRA